MGSGAEQSSGRSGGVEAQLEMRTMRTAGGALTETHHRNGDDSDGDMKEAEEEAEGKDALLVEEGERIPKKVLKQYEKATGDIRGRMRESKRKRKIPPSIRREVKPLSELLLLSCLLPHFSDILIFLLQEF